MGIFSLGSNVLGGGGTTNLWGQPYSQDLYKTAAPTSTAPKTTAPTSYTAPKTGTTQQSTYQPGGLRAGPVTYLPRSSSPAPAPESGGGGGDGRTAVATAGTVGGGGRVTAGGGPNYGGGGGGGSFSFNNTYQAPTMAPIASPDFSGLFAGFGDLLSQSQKGDIPGNVPLQTQKDTMQLQGLRESAAGWNELTGPGGSNPALGNRILPDESKKLAALQSARVY